MIGYRPWPLVKISWLFLTPGLCLVCALQHPHPHLLLPLAISGTGRVLGLLPSCTCAVTCRGCFVPSCVLVPHPPFLARLFALPALPSGLVPALSLPPSHLRLSVCLRDFPAVGLPSLPLSPRSVTHLQREPLPSISRGASVLVFNCSVPRRGFHGLLLHLCLPAVFLGHFPLLLEQVHTSQIQQRLCVPGLGILHRLAPGWLLRELHPTFHRRRPPEDPGFLQEGRGWTLGRTPRPGQL